MRSFNLRTFSFLLPTVSLIAFFSFSSAQAEYQQRLSVGIGFAELKNPSSTDFEIGAEYEYLVDPLIGLGGFVNYIFANPGITYLGAPQISVHPFTTDFLVSASPIVEFGPNVGTNFGVRLGTRVPLPLGPISIVPTFAVDLISGGPDYIFGIGIGI
jgi:hypothetical protein